MNALFLRLSKIRIELYIAATLLVAFLVRVYRLADKNVWWDEGWSIWLAKQDWLAIALRTAADEHPPLHYWMLKVWSAVAGGSSPSTEAFGARFVSVAFGVLTVAWLYRIGKRVGGARVGWLAALLLALARFHIWWSQDIKNYAPSIFFAFVAVGFGLTLIADGEWRMANDKSSRAPHLLSAICYSLFAALALWTHYLAALVLLAVNVYAAILFTTRFWGNRTGLPLRNPPHALFDLRLWVFSQILTIALFVPWLHLYLTNAAAWTAAPAFDFALFLKLVATVLPTGITTNIEDYAPLTLAFTILAVLGCFAGLSIRNPKPLRRPQGPVSAIRNFRLCITNCQLLLFVLILLLPPLLLYALSLTPVSFFAPKIQARYLLILLPAYALLVALGIAFLARLARGLALGAVGFVLFTSVFLLHDYYADRRLRDEYATLVSTINSFARQGDLILLDTDQEYPTFLYYLRAPLGWLGAPNGKAMDAGSADALVQRALAHHAAVWLVAIPDALATDPQRLLEARLARELPKQAEWTFDDKRLALYARDVRDLVQVAPVNLNIQHPLPFIPFPQPHNPRERIGTLLGYDLPGRELRAGDALRVTTYWHAVQTRGELQLLDSAGRVARATPLELAAGKDARVVSELLIPADAAAGEYAVRVMVGGTAHELGRISVESRRAGGRVDKIANPTDYRFGDSIRLIGYDLPQKKITNRQLPLTLYWKPDRAVEKSYVVFAHLLGAQYNAAQNNFLWGQADRAPQPPTRAWRAGEIIADAYRVPIEAHAPPGVYKIEVGLYDPATGTRLTLPDGVDHVILAEVEVGE